MPKPTFYETTQHPKTLALGIHAPYNTSNNINSYYEEFLNLIKTNGVPVEKAILLKLRSIDSGYFLTKGKLEEIQKICLDLKIEQIIISESISAQQERNLTDFLDCKIIDRTQLILEIFEKAAHTAEGKTQVEIAMLSHQKSRISGKGIHLSQQSGVSGLIGGPGETAKERERRYIEKTTLRLSQLLEKMQKSRDTQRKYRLNSQVPQICLIGYTNAGKSTILNTLTKSNVLAEDKLFATLDTTTRELFINGQKKGVISDTVGFIQYLPTRLIDAFKSTLSELQYADLLIHVIDFSDVNWESHIKVVHAILDELNVKKDMIYVFNKADKVDNPDEYIIPLSHYKPHVIVSAQSKEGLEPLIHFLADWQK